MISQGNGVKQNRWAVVIVAARETKSTLLDSIKAAIAAASSVPTQIDVIVNGNRQLAEQIVDDVQQLSAESSEAHLRVWVIRTGDKANALNSYIHRIFPGADIAFFVDGYAQVSPDSFRLMSARLAAQPQALAISAVPTVGRNARSLAEKMIREGGGHGTLNGLRGSVCLELRKHNFRLPLGLYRVDGLLFAALAFNMDPRNAEWDMRRLLVDPEATWTFRPLSVWRPSDLRAHLKRMVRQAQGILENLAIREQLAIQRKPLQALPKTASALVGSWLAAWPDVARKIFLQHPLCLIAAHRLAQPRDWSEPDLTPDLLVQVVIRRDLVSPAPQIPTRGHD